MQKFLNSSGRIVLFDEQAHTLNAIRYSNDRIVASRMICNEINEWIIETLVWSGSLTPYESVVSRTR